MTEHLTWSLCVATLNRVDILSACVRLSVTQTRSPKEIVIVDASDDWQNNHTRIAREITEIGAITAPILIYVPADVKSSAMQRNQGIALASADVLFLIDDDSMMYPNCAAEVMAVYEADTNDQIACVAMVQAHSAPDDDSIEQVDRKDGKEEAAARSSLRNSKIFQLFSRHILMMSADLHFIPYDGPVIDTSPIPAALIGLAEPTGLISGFKSTVRGKVAVLEGFDPALLAYSPGEDLDASYRFSRHGRNVTALKARVYHHEAAAGRIKRNRAIKLGLMNQAYLLRKHSTHLPRHVAVYAWRMVRRLLAEFLKDGLTRRWSFPQFRGALAAAMAAPAIFLHNRANLESWYKTRQLRVLRK